jgi:hypothetical protein
MNANCEACALGPAKIEGHAALMVHILAVAGIVFRCRRCELTWLRSYSANGVYQWRRIVEPMEAGASLGVVMPSARVRPAAVAKISDTERENMDHWLAVQHSWKRTSRGSH